ncbi:hypothetical protein CFB46_22580 [Burkholderia sp. HI2761]|nr:hypothetical protein CFB46_22580 [Burkholderia sp. HI2761]
MLLHMIWKVSDFIRRSMVSSVFGLRRSLIRESRKLQTQGHKRLSTPSRSLLLGMRSHSQFKLCAPMLKFKTTEKNQGRMVI